MASTASTCASALCFFSKDSTKTFEFNPPRNSLSLYKSKYASISGLSSSIPCLASNNFGLFGRRNRILCKSVPTMYTKTTQYEFSDCSADVELRLELKDQDVQSSGDIVVDADESMLSIRVKRSGSIIYLLDPTTLYDKIKPGETIWYIDDDQLVVNLKKQDPELKWPDILESWESLTVGVLPLFKGTSIYLVGDSTEINQRVAEELAVGLGYTPLCTKALLETYAKQTFDSWVIAEGPESIAEAESAILDSLSSHVRAIVATLGGQHGAAGRADKWRHLYAGFTVWLSQSEATDEDSAKEEAKKQVTNGDQAYSNADVVVKLHGWNPENSKAVAQAALSALKQLILSDKKLPGKKSLYIRLGCRGDWPNIKPPGWDPSTGADESSTLAM